MAVFCVALLVLLTVGLIVESLIAPTRPAILRPRTPALGMGVLVVLATLVGTVLPMRSGAWVVSGTVAALAIVAWALRRQFREHEAIPTPPNWRSRLGGWQVGLTLGGGASVSILALSPILRLGFPTTIAAANNDGWSYSGMAAWLLRHPWTASPDNQPLHDTFGSVLNSQLQGGFNVGFETVIATFAEWLDRPTYQLVQIIGALVFVVAAAGWADLALRMRPTLRPGQVGCVVVATTTAGLVAIYSENYFPHAMGIALIPFCLSGIIAWHDQRSFARLARVVVAISALLMVYPGALPWLLGPWILLAIYRIISDGRSGPAQGRGRRLLRAGVDVGLPIVGVFLIAGYQASQALLFLTTKASGAGVPYPALGVGGVWGLATGVVGPLPVVGQSALTQSQVVATAVATGVIAAGLFLLVRTWRKNPQVILAAIGVATVSLVAVVQFARLPDFDYGVFKVSANTSALIAGFAVIGLVSGYKGRHRVARSAALASVTTLWVLASTSMLAASHSGAAGFRAADVTIGRRLAALPQGVVVLVEGTTDSGEVFHQRMNLAYMSPVFADHRTEGLWSTGSYFAPSFADPEWAPAVPWDYVVGNGQESISPMRRAIWSNESYTLWSSPRIDATPYGLGWQAVEVSPSGARFRWINGEGDVYISNRSESPRTAILRTSALAWGHRRVLSFASQGVTHSRFVISPSVSRRIQTQVVVPPRSVVRLRILAGSPTKAPGTDPRHLSAQLSNLSVREK